VKSLTCNLGGKCLTIEIGKIAKQANSSILVAYGDTVVLTALTIQKEATNTDYFSLVVDYRDKFYAAGRFPGGFFKREGAPKTSEILSARLIDRSIRPLFDDEIRNEIYIYTTVLAIDNDNDPDILGVIGASSAIISAGIPFKDGPVSAVRIGKIGDEYVLNPTFTERKESKLDIIVAGCGDKIAMIEAKCNIVSNDEILSAIEFAIPAINTLNKLQEGIKPERQITLIKEVHDENIGVKIRELAFNRLKDVYNNICDADEKKEAINKIWEEIKKEFESKNDAKFFFEKIKKEIARENIVIKGIRGDGRKLNEIRDIECSVGILKRTHGSSLFTRGQTQTMSIITLGTHEDEQLMDEIEGKWNKRFLLHYNFPPYSTGEAKAVKAPGRREIGHGALAERALEPVIPDCDKFPYTIRVVSEIMESNGSTSMASVCGASLSLMDAGVPISSTVSGISIGMVKEGEKIVLLSDISGEEDHIGDMDFKVAGTKEGVTAIQMDIKLSGIEIEIIKNVLEMAKEGIVFILDKMNEVLSFPRKKVSKYAPKISIINIRPDKIRDLIGPSGRNIKKIIEATEAKIDVDDNGKVCIFHSDDEKLKSACDMVHYLTDEVEIGKIYKGKVMKVVNFGAFVEILPGQEGLVHISELAPYRISNIFDVIKEGEEVEVKVVGIDHHGKISLSRKQVLHSMENAR